MATIRARRTRPSNSTDEPVAEATGEVVDPQEPHTEPEPDIPVVRVAKGIHAMFGEGANQIAEDVEKTVGVAKDIFLADNPLDEIKRRFKESK